ncbi:hypothetical protein [Acidisoma silvae]|uniref:Uncharacterized protein n=1 Tax=Acidisoma silvae TaxID=2802396 RepID=A0A963YWS5_9PROT|nr:hypothetical protein [Acidisoma silvae]MCB8877797.1 hypothetical protein [Acidisoma silvae]
MAIKSAQKSAPQPARAPRNRQAITLDLVARLTPSAGQADKLSTAFGLEPVDFDEVRAATEGQLGLSTKVLSSTINETGLRIHLQRVVGAFVGSALGAATFYSAKVTVARELTMKLTNEDRDEDRDGVSGFGSKAARAREFAAQAGLTAFALFAAATGAVHAFQELTGEQWKPYEAPIALSRSVGAQTAALQMDALS